MADTEQAEDVLTESEGIRIASYRSNARAIVQWLTDAEADSARGDKAACVAGLELAQARAQRILDGVTAILEAHQ